LAVEIVTGTTIFEFFLYYQHNKGFNLIMTCQFLILIDFEIPSY